MKKIFIITICMVLTVGLYAQQKLEKKVTSTGATKAENGSVRLQGTLGQTFVGKAENANTKAGIGFWEAVIAGLSTSIEEVDLTKTYSKYFIGQNYPNPASHITTIDLEISDKSLVSIKMYSLIGKYLGELHQATMFPGKYKLTADVSLLKEGQYIYILSAGHKVVDKKSMTVIHSR